ncbi:histidine kinase [Pseudodesulfovibrio sp. JC047]|uniref:AAA family ATPase n=1 Tax=Pseudodesulfovibrio sp. JC047 TaxID=2683199 RepID=UPI0013CFD958|nr:histidine kinase [Pseudodesulfovibrio sp. JC047]NDV20699.1 histidine kinase [Pseudodesulfovibrio sp. JC047]
MNSRIIPISLAVTTKEQQARFERIIAENPMVRLVEDDADEVGILIYEPSASVAEDMPHVIQAFETGQAEDVFLTGKNTDPDILIQAMQSGIREFIKFPVDEQSFRAAIVRTAMRSSLVEDDSEKGRVVTVLGCKSGMGVTSLAVNVASILNEQDPGRTILVDLRRPGGETPYFLDLKYDYSWGDLIEDISRLDATYLQSVVTEHESGLHVLPGPAGFGSPDAHALYLILEQLRRTYTHVVVDTAYPHDEILPKEVEEADDILIAFQLSLPCLARTSRLMDSIRGQDPDAERRMKLVANRVAKNSSIGFSEASDVLGRNVAWVIPDDSAAALSAINQGKPLVQAYPKSPVTKNIRALVADLVPATKLPHRKLSTRVASLFRRKKKDESVAGASI